MDTCDKTRGSNFVKSLKTWDMLQSLASLTCFSKGLILLRFTVLCCKVKDHILTINIETTCLIWSNFEKVL